MHFLCISLYSQVKTIITGDIPDFLNSQAEVELRIYYSNVIGADRKISYLTKTKHGKFNFELNLKEPVVFGANINNKILLFPGTTGTVISPGDSINIEIPDSKILGIEYLTFTGIGSEKINFHKEIVKHILRLYKKDPAYFSQSLDYKFKSADAKLNIIDSVSNSYVGDVNKVERDLIKAMGYNSVLDMLMYSSINSDSDSLHTLFTNYIINKNRIATFLPGNIIHYTGSMILRDYVLLSEFKNPKIYGGAGFRKTQPIQYSSLILKYFSKHLNAKEYLLSDLALNVFLDEQDSKATHDLFDIYSNNVRHDSPFYMYIRDSYQIVQSRLKKGMAFYNFSLPDTNNVIHNLSDFREKLVIIDFWFNGCGGCRQMAPIIEDLENYYKGKNVQFVSISIDTDRKWWLRGIGKFSSRGSLQLFTEGMQTKHPLVKFVNPNGYPFLMAIDKNGNIIGPPPDPRVDIDAFKRYLEKYI